MRITPTFLSAGLVLTSIISLTGVAQPASAAEVRAAVRDVGSRGGEAVETKLAVLDRTQSRWTALRDQETRQLRDAWTRSGFDGAPGEAVDLSSASGWDIGRGQRLLRVPFSSSEGLLRESNMSIVFDSTETVVGSSAIALRSIDTHSGTLRVWTNGARAVERTVSDADVPTASRSTWWGRVNTCFSNAGIAAWAVTAITIACSAACVVTIGAGCLICAAAASGVASGTISYCIGKANQG